jgi:hypothetical protein
MAPKALLDRGTARQRQGATSPRAPRCSRFFEKKNYYNKVDKLDDSTEEENWKGNNKVQKVSGGKKGERKLRRGGQEGQEGSLKRGERRFSRGG